MFHCIYLFINVLLVPQFALAGSYFEMKNKKNGARFLRLVRPGALAWNWMCYDLSPDQPSTDPRINEIHTYARMHHSYMWWHNVGYEAHRIRPKSNLSRIETMWKFTKKKIARSGTKLWFQIVLRTHYTEKQFEFSWSQISTSDILVIQLLLTRENYDFKPLSTNYAR